MSHDDSSNNEVTILVAEDDPDDRMLLQEAFKLTGKSGQVKIFDNGRSLIDDLFEKHRSDGMSPSCVLLDMKMPKLSGIETLKLIRQSPNFNKLRVFVVTGADSLEDVKDSVRFGITQFFRKPNSFEEWVDIAKKIVERCHT